MRRHLDANCILRSRRREVFSKLNGTAAACSSCYAIACINGPVKLHARGGIFWMPMHPALEAKGRLLTMDVRRLLARAAMQCLYQRPGQAACWYEEAFGVPMHPALDREAKGRPLKMEWDDCCLLALLCNCLCQRLLVRGGISGGSIHSVLEAKQKLLKTVGVLTFLTTCLSSPPRVHVEQRTLTVNLGELQNRHFFIKLQKPEL